MPQSFEIELHARNGQVLASASAGRSAQTLARSRVVNTMSTTSATVSTGQSATA
jgi:hypothetical protein